MARSLAIALALLAATPATAEDYRIVQYDQGGQAYVDTDGYTGTLPWRDETRAISQDDPNKIFSCFTVNLEGGNARQLFYDSAKGRIVNGLVYHKHVIPGLDCYDADAITKANQDRELAIALVGILPGNLNRFIAVRRSDGRGWMWTQQATCSNWEPDCGPIPQGN